MHLIISESPVNRDNSTNSLMKHAVFSLLNDKLLFKLKSLNLTQLFLNKGITNKKINLSNNTQIVRKHISIDYTRISE